MARLLGAKTKTAANSGFYSSFRYISPVTLRKRMGELFGDESCTRWWLPGDEGFSPVLQSIRAFADERNATAVITQSESLRDVRQVFAKMDIEGGAGILSGDEGSAKGKGASAL